MPHNPPPSTDPPSALAELLDAARKHASILWQAVNRDREAGQLTFPWTGFPEPLPSPEDQPHAVLALFLLKDWHGIGPVAFAVADDVPQADEWTRAAEGRCRTLCDRIRAEAYALGVGRRIEPNLRVLRRAYYGMLDHAWRIYRAGDQAEHEAAQFEHAGLVQFDAAANALRDLLPILDGRRKRLGQPTSGRAQDRHERSDSAEALVPPALDDESRAMALLIKNPDWSKSRIADELGIHRSKLYRMKKFRAAFDMCHAPERELLRGERGENGNIDARIEE